MNHMTIVVTAYLSIPSKANHEFYTNHIHRFLTLVKNEIVFFTSVDCIDMFRTIRSENIVYVPCTSSDLYTKYNVEFWDRHVELDRGHNHVTRDLAAMWYNKKEFVLRAMTIKPNGPYIWCDAGCIRTDDWKIKYPLRYVPTDDKLVLQLLHPLPAQPTLLTLGSQNIAGALIAGTRQAWITGSRLYDSILDMFDRENLPGAMDQYIWGSAVLYYPADFRTVMYSVPCPDKWFFFLFSLQADDESTMQSPVHDRVQP